MATVLHDSDCAQHNEPAYPNGPCDCGADAVKSSISAIEQETLERAAQAMEPKREIPCDCAYQNDKGAWVHECSCQNSGDYAAVTLWCADKNNATIIRNLPLKYAQV